MVLYYQVCEGYSCEGYIGYDDDDDDDEGYSSPYKPATSQVLFTTVVDPVLCLFPNLQTCIILQRNSKWELMELKLEVCTAIGLSDKQI